MVLQFAEIDLINDTHGAIATPAQKWLFYVLSSSISGSRRSFFIGSAKCKISLPMELPFTLNPIHLFFVRLAVRRRC